MLKSVCSFLVSLHLRNLEETWKKIHTHTKEKQLLYNITVDTQVHLGTAVLYRGSVILSQTTTVSMLYCGDILLSRLPYRRLNSRWTFSISSTLSFNPSISFLSASTSVFTSVLEQWAIPSGKLQTQLSKEHFPGTFNLNDRWSFDRRLALPLFCVEQLLLPRVFLQNDPQLLTETELWHPWKLFNPNCVKTSVMLNCLNHSQLCCELPAAEQKGYKLPLGALLFAPRLGSSVYHS